MTIWKLYLIYYTNLSIQKKCFLVQNICLFDLVSVLIIKVYIDNDQHKKYMKKWANDLLQFCKSLATELVSKTTYKFHLSLLQMIFSK